jgi:hypothetical protein
MNNINAGPGLYPSIKNYGQISTGGNLHDTLRFDRYDNIYGGHTTVDLGGGMKKSLPWGPQPPQPW